ncbi:putative transposase [Shigella boydii 5216-82]|nr:putative transposase [Shigella boydii 5216-82]
MNSQTTKDIPCFRSYLPDALRLRFEDKLTIRDIAQRLGLSHSTIHTLFQRFLASGIAWPLPDSVSFAQLDAILYANRKEGINRASNQRRLMAKRTVRCTGNSGHYHLFFF